jgi:pimeloyl-ACP methyl ester carboxylesterase
MLRTSVLALAVSLTVAQSTAAASQPLHTMPAVSVAGDGPETVVLLTGLVGGVAGFRRLEARLLEQQCRVVIINAYLLSIDSAEVSFHALGRRVDRVLDSLGVVGARVVGHGHGGGVAIRLAANAPQRVAALYLLDIGASAVNRSPIFNNSIRLVPLIARVPGGRGFIRKRMIRGLRESSGRDGWIDAVTERAYTEPMLGDVDRVIGMAIRLARAEEPDSLSTLIDRLRIPVTVLLGGAPHTAAPTPDELQALEPLGTLLRIERLPDVGHFPHEETPDDVIRHLLARRSIIVRQ